MNVTEKTQCPNCGLWHDALVMKYGTRAIIRCECGQMVEPEMLYKEDIDTLTAALHTREVSQQEVESGKILRKQAEKMWRDAMVDRERILKAFIAETGCKPSECEQVLERSGSAWHWHVQKAKKTTFKRYPKWLMEPTYPIADVTEQMMPPDA